MIQEMDEYLVHASRWATVVMTSVITLVIAVFVAALLNFWVGAGVFLGLFGAFLLESLRNIPNQPPQKGVLTLLGERTNAVMNEGWNVFPFYPYLFGYVGVEVKRVPKEFIVKVRTPDRASSNIPIALTYLPLNLINFLNNGAHQGVEQQLSGKINERVREWAMADEEGPRTWVELQKSRLEAASVLTKAIGFNNITIIPEYAQDVPTIIWIRYFTKPRPTKFSTENEKEWIGEDGKWEKVEEVIVRFSDDLIERERLKKNLEKAVAKRREEVEALRAGSGNVIIEDLGIAIKRLNVGEIDVLGEVAKAAETQAKEEEERKAETLELIHVQKRIKELMDTFNYTAEQALEIVQTERSKVVKTIAETKFNISPETREMVKEVIPAVATAIAGVFGKGEKA